MAEAEPIAFITSNAGKLSEVQALLPQVRGVAIDLPEIQSLDPRAVIAAKLDAACRHGHRRVLVEDTSLEIAALGGLPGTLIKWFLQAMGVDGIARISSALGDGPATARTIFGFDSPAGRFYGEGVLPGRIVAPRGKGFGWDPIFQPEGTAKTFGEMATDEKQRWSMRRMALEQLCQAVRGMVGSL